MENNGRQRSIAVEESRYFSVGSPVRRSYLFVMGLFRRNYPEFHPIIA